MSEAAPSEARDARLLNVFLLLERLQQRFYAGALERGMLRGELLAFAGATERQEATTCAA